MALGGDKKRSPSAESCHANAAGEPFGQDSMATSRFSLVSSAVDLTLQKTFAHKILRFLKPRGF